MHNTRVRLTRRRLYLEKRFHESKQMVATRNPGDIIAKTREVTASHVGRNTAEISRSFASESLLVPRRWHIFCHRQSRGILFTDYPRLPLVFPLSRLLQTVQTCFAFVYNLDYNFSVFLCAKIGN